MSTEERENILKITFVKVRSFCETKINYTSHKIRRKKIFSQPCTPTKQKMSLQNIIAETSVLGKYELLK